MARHIAPKREHLLEVATQLFHRYGYHAVGLDTILEKSEVSRTTLFKHFPNKDALIVTALKRRDQQAREHFFKALTEHPGPFSERIAYMFDLLAAWVRREDFTGCLFINATAEYADHRDPIHQAAKAHKDAYRDFLTHLAADAGALDPAMLAEQLMLLADGLIVTCHVAGPRQFPEGAKAAALQIVRVSLGQFESTAETDSDRCRDD